MQSNKVQLQLYNLYSYGFNTRPFSYIVNSASSVSIVASLCRIILIVAVTVRPARALASIWAARAIGATVRA